MQQDKTKELMTEHFLLPKTSLGVFSGNFFMFRKYISYRFVIFQIYKRLKIPKDP